MSNFLAVATVTAVLRQLLQDALDASAASEPGAVAGATVTSVRPDGPSAGIPDKGVNVYLYQVTPNAAARNGDLPTRAADGRLVQRARAAIDLHYLLTFYGSEAELEPQRLLGAVVRTLHARPVLTRPLITGLVENPAVDYLASSDLADDVELVRFTPTMLSLEELAKLWSVFFQTPHVLSAAYQAAVVLIEGPDTPSSALPVRERTVHAIPFRHPVIERVRCRKGTAPAVVDAPILPGDTLVLVGRQLAGRTTRVRVGAAVLEPDDVSDARVSVRLASPPFAPDALRAGVQGAQVVHELHLGTPGDPHRGVESNVCAFVLRPRIDAAQATAGDVTVDVTPVVGPRQRVRLLLNARSAPSAVAHTFALASRDGDLPTATLTVPITGVAAGEYLVRIQVDGAESLLDTDPASATFGPTVTIP
ncbi:MAG: DUF4255 domain-containing protein [Candidatus Rokubacteria bacterium]|nr:DUF4255 domain-containing protein [Candidatus Rokubacteria bacterium]